MTSSTVIATETPAEVPAKSLTSYSLPPTQTALVALSEGKYAISRSHPLPTLPLPPTYILIRISHIALNPCNWKMIDFSPAIGSVGGNDFSGEVIAVGSAVARRRPGDSVCGFLYGLDPHLGDGEWAGAFAQYVSVDEGLVMSIYPGIGMAESACLGAGVITAGIALFRSLGLKEITESKEDSKKERQYLLIYGGSTATGTMAIQLAKA
jgi:aspyridone synthetase trans-acting enoyl reductase